MDKLRCGAIGVGSMGRQHARSIQAIEVTELVAVCDVSEECVQGAAKELGVDQTCTDYRAMLDDPSIDAVTICTPHSLHSPMCLEAMDAGKHVITEKPMAVTLEQADQMIGSAKKNGVYLGCSEEHRFTKQIQLVKKWMNEGRLGDPFRCAYERGIHFRTARLSKRDPGAWRNKKDLMGGGEHMDLGHHAVDTALYLMGEFTTCYGHTSNRLGGMEGEDTVATFYRHENGTMSQIYIGPGAQGWSVTIVGTEAEARVSPIRGPGTVSLVGRDDQTVEVSPPAGYAKSLALEKFFTAIIGGTPLEYPPEEARKALAAVLAAYESTETGLPVAVNAGRPG